MEVTRDNPFFEKLSNQRGKLIIILGASGSGKSRIKHPQLISIAKDTGRDERPTDAIDKSTKPNYYHQNDFPGTFGYNFLGKSYSFNMDYVEGLLADGISTSVIITDEALVREIKRACPNCYIIRAKSTSIDKTKEMMQKQGRSPQEIEKRIAQIAVQDEKFDNLLDITDYVIENDYTPAFDAKVRQVLADCGAIVLGDQEQRLNDRVQNIYQERDKLLKAGTSAIILPVDHEVIDGKEYRDFMYVKFVNTCKFPEFFEKGETFLNQSTYCFKVKTQTGVAQMLNKYLYYPSSYLKYDGSNSLHYHDFPIIVHPDLFKFTRCFKNLFSSNTPLGINVTVSTDGLYLWYGAYEGRGELTAPSRLNKGWHIFSFNQENKPEKKTGMLKLSKNYKWQHTPVDQDLDSQARDVAIAMAKDLITGLAADGFAPKIAQDYGKLLSFTEKYLSSNPQRAQILPVEQSQQILAAGQYFETLFALNVLRQQDPDMFTAITDGLNIDNQIKNAVKVSSQFGVVNITQK